jgi:hypothetical protein
MLINYQLKSFFIIVHKVRTVRCELVIDCTGTGTVHVLVRGTVWYGYLPNQNKKAWDSPQKPQNLPKKLRLTCTLRQIVVSSRAIGG